MHPAVTLTIDSVGCSPGVHTLAHSSVLAIVDATRTVRCALSVQRLVSQLQELAVGRLVVLVRPSEGARSAADSGVETVPSPTQLEDLRAVAELLRERDDVIENVVLISGDIVLHTRGLRTALTGSAPRLLVSRRSEPDAFGVHLDRDRVVSAGSAYHSVSARNGSFLDVVGVGSGQRPALADDLERWAVASAEPSLPALAGVALVRSGTPVRAVDIREFGWRRASDDVAAQAAVAELSAADEERCALNSAVKAEDEAFTTFLVSPYSRYIARWCARRGILPNAVTIVSILLGLGAAAGFAFGTRIGLVVGAVLLQMSFVLDCVDGQLARYTATFSSFGAWLDITFDRAMEYAVYAGLAVGAGRAGLGNLWPWALAALVVRVSRHFVDFSFVARPVPEVRVIRDLSDPDDGLPAGGGGGVERT